MESKKDDEPSLFSFSPVTLAQGFAALKTASHCCEAVFQPCFLL